MTNRCARRVLPVPSRTRHVARDAPSSREKSLPALRGRNAGARRDHAESTNLRQPRRATARLFHSLQGNSFRPAATFLRLRVFIARLGCKSPAHVFDVGGRGNVLVLVGGSTASATKM